MAGKKRPSSAVASDYESDGGFVEDAPKSKKAKTTKTAKKGTKSSEAAAEYVAGGGQVGKDGDVYWEVCRFTSSVQRPLVVARRFISSCLGGEGRVREGVNG
jgi:hypothetical protein